jgi:hypothetical protein
MTSMAMGGAAKSSIFHAQKKEEIQPEMEHEKRSHSEVIVTKKAKT